MKAFSSSSLLEPVGEWPFGNVLPSFEDLLIPKNFR